MLVKGAPYRVSYNLLNSAFLIGLEKVTVESFESHLWLYVAMQLSC